MLVLHLHLGNYFVLILITGLDEQVVDRITCFFFLFICESSNIFLGLRCNEGKKL